ncbi:unnamed protein product [Somion occarium]|uniref:Fungal-type protein kinase domain-containing protein n=1 Tax=Somion occarium TaxID=3059160 RepID=A0ABP1DWU8_9APHY
MAEARGRYVQRLQFERPSSPLLKHVRHDNRQPGRPFIMRARLNDHFITEHLRRLKGSLYGMWASDRYSDLINNIKRTNNRSMDSVYQHVCDLLNSMSYTIYQHLKEHERICESALPILFLDYHNTAPTLHFEKLEYSPQIVGIRATPQQVQKSKLRRHAKTSPVPYCFVETVAEFKSDPDIDPKCFKYAKQLLAARPDMPSVYTLAIRPDGYYVLWNDSSNKEQSFFHSWRNLELLAAYFNTLYQGMPGTTHLTQDPTCSRPRISPVTGQPTWIIRHNGQSYENCEHIFAGYVRGKRTKVWFSSDSGHRDSKRFYVIKEAYQHDSREGELLLEVHRGNAFPGVVRFVHAGPVTFKDEGTECHVSTLKLEDDTEVTKRRLILASLGTNLDDAKTMKDILMALYDALEVHRGLVDKHFLHRDMTANNILIYPRHSERGYPGWNKYLLKIPHKFIDEILGTPHKHVDKSRCLLIDMDYAVRMTEVETGRFDGPSERKCAVGTSSFVARSVSLRRTRWDDKKYRPMPELTERAKELYLAAYGQEKYSQYCDKNGTFHAGREVQEDDDICVRPFLHKPEHDAESVFWVLIWYCLRALPKGCDEEWTVEISNAWKDLSDHHLGRPETRGDFFKFTAQEYKGILHSKLSSLAPLLHSLAAQVFPDYEYLKPTPPEDHLHEAMRRLLLQFIVGMDDPIELTPGVSRQDVARARPTTVRPPTPPLPPPKPPTPPPAPQPSPAKRKRRVQPDRKAKKARLA